MGWRVRRTTAAITNGREAFTMASAQKYTQNLIRKDYLPIIGFEGWYYSVKTPLSKSQVAQSLYTHLASPNVSNCEQTGKLIVRIHGAGQGRHHVVRTRESGSL